MILTIGMIVKNEEKNLERCLDSIKPILENVDCELIITDTGSTDKTVEIAKKYTDKILYFEWVDDFAAARNTAFEIAQGEWFMFLDADDVFESCDNIIDFFNSGEYHRYNSASYIYKSICDNGEQTIICKVPRLTKLTKETKFINEIHELLTTYRSPKKDLGDVAVHYGYFYASKEEQKKKHDRNERLLLKRLAKATVEQPYIYLQLCEGAIEEEEAFKYIDAGIQAANEYKEYIPAIALYAQKITIYTINGRLNEAYDLCKEYFALDKTIRPGVLSTDCEIYALQSMILYSLENYNDSLESYNAFFELYDKRSKGVLNTRDSDLVNIRASVPDKYLQHFIQFLDCAIRTNQPETVHKYIRELHVDNFPYNAEILSEFVATVLLAAQSARYENIEDYYNCLNDEGKNIFIRKLYFKICNGEKPERLLNALDHLAERYEQLYMKVQLLHLICSDKLSESVLRKYIQDHGINDDPDIIYYFLKYQFDISFVVNIAGIDLKKIVYICCTDIYDFYSALENYDPTNIMDVGVVSAVEKLYDYCISVLLLKNSNIADSDETIEKLIRKKNELKSILAKEINKREFEQLSCSIKNNIMSLIRNNDFNGAKKILDEYSLINPNDPDIAELSTLITDR